MNVIISQDKSIRFTQESNSAYNIQDIIFYISKAIEVESIQLQLKKVRSTYPFDMNNTDTAVNYNIYRVAFTQPVTLSAREYDMVLVINGEEYDIGAREIASIQIQAPRQMTYGRRTATTTSGPFGLTDAHEPIEIVDRRIVITNNQNILIAEDNISQAITFRMPRYYDGIDLLEKDIYFDYITTEDGVEVVKNIPLSNLDGAGNSYITVESSEDETQEFLKIPFAIPYALTQKAGTIQFALSAIDLSAVVDAISGESRYYVWQTLPASLTIQPNLFKRNAAPEADDVISSSEELMQQIDALTQTTEELETLSVEHDERLDTIEGSDIYVLDRNPDGEIILGSGDASDL